MTYEDLLIGQPVRLRLSAFPEWGDVPERRAFGGRTATVLAWALEPLAAEVLRSDGVAVWIGLEHLEPVRDGTFVVHAEIDQYDVYCGRWSPHHGPGSVYGNPFRIQTGRTREEAVALFCDDPADGLVAHPAIVAGLPGIRGKRLACWCKTARQPLQLCHCDVLRRLLWVHAAEDFAGEAPSVMASLRAYAHLIRIGQWPEEWR